MADPTKLAAASAFDSVKNYGSPNDQTTTFSGLISSGGTLTRTNIFTFTRQEGSIPLVLLNYSRGPNSSTDWFIAESEPTFGGVDLDSGFGYRRIDVKISYTDTTLTVEQSVFNPDAIGHNIVSTVTGTVRVAFYVVTF